MARHLVQDLWLIAICGLIPFRAGWSTETVPAGYRAVAAEHGIPSTVLYAVALTESGCSGIGRPWPWTLNVDGRGYFFDSRQAAWQALMKWLRAGRHSIDIGLMQVNWHYHKERLGTPWQALDPYHNLRVGAAILKTCFHTRQDWWASVGCYHAPTDPQRAEQYRHRVASRWQRIVRAG